MRYQALLKRLDQRGLYRIRPELERVSRVLSYLKNPQDRVRCIHVAGTNGKGSVSAILESVLRQAGYRTGLYTSPHLFDIRERIQIQRSPISMLCFQETAEKIFQAEKQTACTLTHFEFITVLAYLCFAEAPVDVAVIEVGMGGRWDATNVIQNPILTFVTSIGLDHTQWLGHSKVAIAREKAGIIKAGVPVISGVIGAAGRAIEAVAKSSQAKCLQLGRDFFSEEDTVHWERKYQRMSYTGIQGSTRTVALNLLGRYQVQNAALALAGIELLQRKGWSVPPKAIERGLAKVNWPGRFQWIAMANGRQILFDGAHNPPATLEFLSSLQHSPWNSKRKTFVFGVFRDKDYAQMLRRIQPKADQIVFCTLPGDRGLPARELGALIKRKRTLVHVVPDPERALQTAIGQSSRNDLIVVTGSFSLLGILLKNKTSAGRADRFMQRRVSVGHV